MPIFCKDQTAEQLLDDVIALSGAKTKTSALITALRHEKSRLSKKTPISERITCVQKLYAQIGNNA